MKVVVKEENKDSLFAEPLTAMAALVTKEKEADFEHSKDYIKRGIKREIMLKLYGQTGMYEEIVLKSDPDVQKALELAKDDKEYSRIMSGQKTDNAKI